MVCLPTRGFVFSRSFFLDLTPQFRCCCPFEQVRPSVVSPQFCLQRKLRGTLTYFLEPYPWFASARQIPIVRSVHFVCLAKHSHSRLQPASSPRAPPACLQPKSSLPTPAEGAQTAGTVPSTKTISPRNGSQNTSGCSKSTRFPLSRVFSPFSDLFPLSSRVEQTLGALLSQRASRAKSVEVGW